MEKAYVLKTTNSARAVSKLFDQFDLSDFKGGKIALKANHNSADPFPASTHLDTLGAFQFLPIVTDRSSPATDISSRGLAIIRFGQLIR